MNIWVLIFVISTSSSSQSGAASVVQEFTSYAKCTSAAEVLAKDAKGRDKTTHVLAFACVER